MKKFLEIIINITREKAEYKAYRKLKKSLPEDYQFVSNEIENYMFCITMDESVFTVLMNTVKSFAAAAADGCSVLSVTGEDVGLFCDNLLKKSQIKTWAEKQKEELNEKIHKKFETKTA